MKKLDKTSEHFRINEVAALIEMSKMYTEKDLCEFAEWCNGNSWLYANYSKLWTNIGGVQKTTSQLREQWEIETGKISSINKKQGCALEAKDICDYDEKCDDCPHFH